MPGLSSPTLAFSIRAAVPLAHAERGHLTIFLVHCPGPCYVSPHVDRPCRRRPAPRRVARGAAAPADPRFAGAAGLGVVRGPVARRDAAARRLPPSPARVRGLRRARARRAEAWLRGAHRASHVAVPG